LVVWDTLAHRALAAGRRAFDGALCVDCAVRHKSNMHPLESKTHCYYSVDVSLIVSDALEVRSMPTQLHKEHGSDHVLHSAGHLQLFPVRRNGVECQCKIKGAFSR
jgi:hypothetical protein